MFGKVLSNCQFFTSLACIYIMQVIWKYFYSIKSAGDYGTLCHLRNRLNRSNVSNPTRDFNACEDFFVHSHIITATLEYFDMEKMDVIKS